MSKRLDNYSDGDLADELGALRADLAELKSRESEIRDELMRRSVTEAEGALFRVTVSTMTQWRLDAAAVKTEMGEDWYDRHCRASTVTTVKATARKAAQAA